MRPDNRQLLRSLLFALAGSLVLSLSLWAADDHEPKAVDTLPADGAVVDKPVRSLRVWFDESPDVASAVLTLEGPPGAKAEVTGLHTMGDDDLMARVVGRLPDGEYTAKWSFGDGEGAVTGSWTFEIRRGGASSEGDAQEKDPPRR